MNNGNHNMEYPKKMMEPLIIPKPRPSMKQHLPNTPNNVPTNQTLPVGASPKYTELLQAIEELGNYIRPSYAGHRSSAEKVKHGIIKARVLVKECIVETERIARQ